MDLFKIIVIVIVIIIIVALIIYYVSLNTNNVINTSNENNIYTENGNVGDEIMDKAKYINITASQMVEEIKNMSKEEYVILDVRTKEEYEEQRIPNSVLLTLSEIESKAESVLPNKNIKIYVYCRSGNRSRQAAYKLIDLGYKYVYDFGGIINYPYEKISGK